MSYIVSNLQPLTKYYFGLSATSCSVTVANGILDAKVTATTTASRTVLRAMNAVRVRNSCRPPLQLTTFSSPLGSAEGWVGWGLSPAPEFGYISAIEYVDSATLSWAATGLVDHFLVYVKVGGASSPSPFVLVANQTGALKGNCPRRSRGSVVLTPAPTI